MPIKMKQFEDGNVGPVFVCLYCGKEITGMGNAVWRWEGDSPTSSYIEFTHKRCDDENQAHDNFRLSAELDAWLMWLVGNAKIDLEAAREREGWLEADDKEDDA